MSPVRLFSILLLTFTVLLYVGSTYLRHDLARRDSHVQEVERVSQIGIRSAVKLYHAAAMRSTALTEGLGELSGSFADGLAYLAHRLVEVDSVEFENNYHLDDSLLRALIKADTEPNALALSLQERIEGLQRHPWIESAEIRWRVLPIGLRVRIVEAEPWIVAEYAGHSWLLSRQRKLLSPLAALPNPNLIEVTSSKGRIDGLADTPGVDNYLSSENARLDYATKMVELLEMASVFDYEIDRFTLLADGSLLISARPPTELPPVRLNVHSLEEAEVVAYQLKAVLKDLALRQERPREIDLRFQPQVIVR